MIFTSEQFFIELGGREYFAIDDFPLDWWDNSLLHEVFNCLPEDIQGEVVSWGFDTVVKEKIFGFLLETQLGMSFEEYYDSDIAKEYFENDKKIKIDFNKFPNYKKEDEFEFNIIQTYYPPWVSIENQDAWVNDFIKTIKEKLNEGKQIEVFDFGYAVYSCLIQKDWDRLYCTHVKNRKSFYQDMIRLGQRVPNILIPNYEIYIINDTHELREDYDRKRLNTIPNKRNKS